MTDRSVPPEVGKTFWVEHYRKGRFALKITEIAEERVTGTIVEGRARYASDAARFSGLGSPGDTITVNGIMCRFLPYESELV